MSWLHIYLFGKMDFVTFVLSVYSTACHTELLTSVCLQKCLRIGSIENHVCTFAMNRLTPNVVDQLALCLSAAMTPSCR